MSQQKGNPMTLVFVVGILLGDLLLLAVSRVGSSEHILAAIGLSTFSSLFLLIVSMSNYRKSKHRRRAQCARAQSVQELEFVDKEPIYDLSIDRAPIGAETLPLKYFAPLNQEENDIGFGIKGELNRFLNSH